MTKLESGVAHKLPTDMKKAIVDNKLELTWNYLTPLARNEWICWTISVKQEITRIKHIKRLCDDLKKGKKRPCCWPGCSHR